MEENNNGYGGLWTVEKLEILTLYLQMYTTALQEKFRLVYIDAFAGSGSLSYRVNKGLNFRDASKLYEGSARRAVAIDENPFDYLVFVEKDEKRYKKLQQIKSANPNRNIKVFNKDANEYLQNLSIRPGSKMRGDRNSHQIRASGVEPILNLFKDRLFELLKHRFLKESRSLYNTKKVPIFEFLFFVGSSSPRAIKAAKDMALYLIKKHRF